MRGQANERASGEDSTAKFQRVAQLADGCWVAANGHGRRCRRSEQELAPRTAADCPRCTLQRSRLLRLPCGLIEILTTITRPSKRTTWTSSVCQLDGTSPSARKEGRTYGHGSRREPTWRQMILAVSRVSRSVEGARDAASCGCGWLAEVGE